MSWSSLETLQALHQLAVARHLTAGSSVQMCIALLQGKRECYGNVMSDYMSPDDRVIIRLLGIMRSVWC